MLTTAAFSLLLLAAQPPATDADGPVSTQSQAPRIPAAAPRDPKDLPVPAGAPSDDFGLTAWCHGALRGHMALAAQIGEVDQDQEAIGRQYLAGYETALAAAPRGKTAEGRRAAEAARAAGYGSWAAARESGDKDTQKFTYLGWQLPGRCEHAATRLSGNPALFGAVTATAEPPLPTGDPRTTP